jgi:hypothetical protein
MALKQTITLVDQFDENVTFANAYLRVDRLEGGKNEMTVYLSFYKTPESTRILTSKNYKFQPDLGGANFLAQAYGHLKTLPEFAGAVDC